MLLFFILQYSEPLNQSCVPVELVSEIQMTIKKSESKSLSLYLYSKCVKHVIC